MASSDQIDIIQLPRRGLSGGTEAWPKGWPEDVVLALRRDATGMSLMPCHAEEGADMLVDRLSRIEGLPPQRYRIYPPVIADQHAETIERLLRSDEDLFERAEEFALNYEFMLPRPEPAAAALPEPALPSAEAAPAPAPAPPQEAAVELSGLALQIAPDGAARLQIPGGSDSWQAAPEVVTQSPDGSRMRLDLGPMLARGGNPGEIHLPPDSFVFRDLDYAISRRGDVLYFLPKFTAPTLVSPPPRQRLLLGLAVATGLVLLLGGILIGRGLAPDPLVERPPVEVLRDSIFAAP